MMSEGPTADGGIGWQPGQELSIRGLALLTLTLWIAAGWMVLRSRR
ncbi:MAG: hypothetical protein M9921_05050 [Fimbriimonadaceae bacterium]|nr:hypothetical protein [Fimbriimonadaceae bacterium]